MKINPSLEAITFEVDAAVDITLEKFARALAEKDSDIQAAFFDSFFSELWAECGASAYHFETQVHSFINAMEHDRAKDTVFAKEWTDG